MPYRTLDDLPGPIKANLPRHAQEIFMAAYNSAAKEHPGEDDTCAKIAWAAVKMKFHRDDSGEWVAKGGPGSGNWGHAGRPGELGGSMPGGGVFGLGEGATREGAAMSIATGQTAAERQAAARAAGDAARAQQTAAAAYAVKPESRQSEIIPWGEGKGTVQAAAFRGGDVSTDYMVTLASRESLGLLRDGTVNWRNAGRVQWAQPRAGTPMVIPKNAKIPFQEALRIAGRRHVASWVRETGESREAITAWLGSKSSRTPVNEALRMISLDHYIRTVGRTMVAKYPGLDAVTGVRINPGDSIIYAGTGKLVKK